MDLRTALIITITEAVETVSRGSGMKCGCLSILYTQRGYAEGSARREGLCRSGGALHVGRGSASQGGLSMSGGALHTDGEELCILGGALHARVGAVWVGTLRVRSGALYSRRGSLCVGESFVGERGSLCRGRSCLSMGDWLIRV